MSKGHPAVPAVFFFLFFSLFILLLLLPLFSTNGDCARAPRRDAQEGSHSAEGKLGAVVVVAAAAVAAAVSFVT